MAKKSGLDALLEALKNSGVDTDDVGSAFKSDQAKAEKPGESKESASTGESRASGTQRGWRRRTTSGGSTGGSGGGRGGRGGSGGDGGDDGKSGGIPGMPDFDLSFLDNIPRLNRRHLIVTIVVAIVVLAALYWWFHPPINVHSAELWIIVAIVVLLPVFLFFAYKSRNYKVGTEKVEVDKKKSKRYRWLCLIPIAIAAAGVVGGILSLSIIPGNAERFSNVLKTDNLNFAEDIKEVNYSEIPVIDQSSAILLGNREMGSIPEYVSQFEVSTLYSQINYHQQPVRVSPLNYADLFKWFVNREGGIPAYALVNMTTQDAEIVRLGDNPIHYSQSEPLVRNIDRHVQLTYPFYIFDEKAFEIDEDGHPWWICPVRDYTIGLFGGETITRVVLCDATTGECQDLALEDCPQWVDKVFPAELLIEQYNWYGSLHNGWLNSFLGQEGVVRTTPGGDGQPGYNYLAKDDDVWVYTGVTSATADNSIVGFVLINQRTHESHFYSVSGATEESAMSSAEGQVQNLRYTATFPLLINVANQPTYFMALKDGAGLVKKFAMVDIQRYQNVATGDTVADTQRAYEALLATNGVTTDASDISDVKEITGTIRTMAQAVVESNSHFYVTLNGVDGIFDFGLPGLVQIVGYAVGDEITFTYIESPGTNPVYGIGPIDAQQDTATGEEPQADSTDVPAPDAGDTQLETAET